MKTLSRTLAALCLAATAVAAQAVDSRVAVTADFTLTPALIASPGTLSLDFHLAEPIAGVIAPYDTSFSVVDVARASARMARAARGSPG